MGDAKIIIVDDEPAIVKLCQRFLERANYDVVSVTDPRVALELFEQEKFDLLLVDFRMPVLDGFELVERARRIQPDLAVVVMTGFGTVETAIQALRKGIDALILKPFERGTDLVETTRLVLRNTRMKRDAARLSALTPLFDISETLISETDPKILTGLILEKTANLLQAKHIAIFSQDPVTGEFKNVANVGRKLEVNVWGLLPFEEALNRKDPVLMVSAGPGDPNIHHVLQDAEWGSILWVPVTEKRNRFIFMAAREADQAAFLEADRELLTILARQSAVALENAQLYSELRDYVKQIEDSQRALIQAEKMAAVGRLMASVAHEINNPLQSIQNCLYLANRKEMSPERREKYLEMAQVELDRLANTVQNMLSFSRVGGVEGVVFDLKDLIQQVVEFVHSQLQKRGVEVIIQADNQIPELFGHPDQLKQVFLNLLLNASDAMENMPGDQADKTIWIDLSQHDEKVYTRVEDSGPGIPPGFEQRIFEPFVSTKKEGTGLGLSISYGVIKSHGGNLSVVPGNHGNGACFEIVLAVNNNDAE